MAPTAKQSPIIMLGMHRSGTSMLCRSVEQMGVFVGQRKDENNEATFFIKKNDWIFNQVNARIDTIQGFDFLDDELRLRMADVLQSHLSNIGTIEFLGKRYFKYRSVFNISERWGWKDPRNTFTLPVWAHLFPKPKVLHIYRHPIDVALSQQVKERRVYATKLSRKFRLKLREKMLKGKIGPGSVRFLNLREGFRIWSDYTNQAFAYTDDGFDILHIQYEKLLQSPEPVLRQIADFLELDVPQTVLQQAASSYDGSRGLAFRNADADLSSIANLRDSELVKRLGYDSDWVECPIDSPES